MFLVCQGVACSMCNHVWRTNPILFSPQHSWTLPARAVLTTSTLLQGVLTPFDRLDGYERKIQNGTNAAATSEDGAAVQSAAGTFHVLVFFCMTTVAQST